MVPENDLSKPEVLFLFSIGNDYNDQIEQATLYFTNINTVKDLKIIISNLWLMTVNNYEISFD